MADRPRRRFGSRRSRGGADGAASTARDDVVRLGEPASRRDGVEGRIEVGPGVSLWYRVDGAGPNAVVVPTAGNHRDLAGLASPSRTVVAYDVRGRGRSDAVDAAHAGFAAEVADLEVVATALGLATFAVVGCSYHAGVAAAFGLEHPTRLERLVLAAAVPIRADARPGPARQPAPHQVAHLDQLDAAGLRTSDPAAFCRAWREVYVPLLMARPEAYARMADVCHLPNEHPSAVARSLVHVFGDLKAYDWRGPLRGLDVPTLVVHGSEDQDPVAYAAEWVDALPDARLLEIAGVGQLPWIEDPDAFFPAVGRFLDGAAI